LACPSPRADGAFALTPGPENRYDSQGKEFKAIPLKAGLFAVGALFLEVCF